MILPLALIGLAILSAGVMAYGTGPNWGQYPHGIEFIMLSRRLEWPLVSISILLCIVLIALVVAGKRRTWFLIGLAPVLALFAHHFRGQPVGSGIADGPAFVKADAVRGVADDDYVVGLHFGDADYAYSYASLFSMPVILQADRDKRLLLIWNAYANRAMGLAIGHDLKARDLEIVSSPANALLLYNGRTGQFINGITGRTPKGEKPSDVLDVVHSEKMPWRQWRSEHPETLVLALPIAPASTAPTHPILPAYPVPKMTLDQPAGMIVALVGDVHPMALQSDAIGKQPLNLNIDSIPVFVVRESPAEPIIAFDRRLPDEFRPRFDLAKGRRANAGMFVDADTNSLWSAQGVWVSGLKELKGKKLAGFPVDDGLYWGVMKFWYPALTIAGADSAKAGSTK